MDILFQSCFLFARKTLVALAYLQVPRGLYYYGYPHFASPVPDVPTLGRSTLARGSISKKSNIKKTIYGPPANEKQGSAASAPKVPREIWTKTNDLATLSL